MSKCKQTKMRTKDGAAFIRPIFMQSHNEECAICSRRMLVAAFRLEGVLEGMPPVFICSPECVVSCMNALLNEEKEEDAIAQKFDVR